MNIQPKNIKMKIWNFGIVGAGNIADFHAKAVQSLGNAKLAGICGTNPDKVKILATKYSCRVFNNTDEICINLHTK